MLLDFLSNDITFEAFASVLFTLVIALSVHEFAHAWMANYLGDPTARLRGRLTLNPAAHIDPTGAVLMLLAGFGWGKPVPVNPIQLGTKGWKLPMAKAGALVAAAGPVSNFLMATVAGLLLRFEVAVDFPNLIVFLYFFAYINVGLGVFNLIPVNPLDGGKILAGFLPARVAYSMQRLDPMQRMLMLYVAMFIVFRPVMNVVSDAFFTVVVGWDIL